MNEEDSRQANIDETDFRLWRYMDHTRYMIFRSREKELAQVGLTPEQAYVLDILDAAGGATTINHIAQATQRQHNSISTLMTRMAKLGLIRKTRTRRDKRIYRIALTSKGRSIFTTIPRSSVTQALSCLSAEEKTRMVEYLDRLLSHAYESTGQSYGPEIFLPERNEQ